MASRALTSAGSGAPGERWLAPVRETGELASFSVRVIVALVGSGRYAAEILRQCSILIVGSSLVLVAMMMVIGGECGLFVTYLTRPLGASAANGVVMTPCAVREMFPYMFAYIFAAKVCCGLVAEIGSMRISSEISAMESVGIDPTRYVLATRLVAVWICVPAIFIVGLVTGLVGGYLVSVVQLGDLSGGQFLDGYFASQTLGDDLMTLVRVLTTATVVTLVALYYGYRASGGPVGVGDAVARSMVVNLVLIHLIGGFYSLVLYGPGTAPYPFGG